MTTTSTAGPDTQAPARNQPTATDDSIEALAERLDQATRATRDLDPLPRQLLGAQLAALNALHANGLRTIVRSLRTDPRGTELLYELVDDPVVHMLLSMHGIIRPDPTIQAGAVLDQVRPGLQSHGGDVELDRIEDGTAYVRLQGACNGCSMAAVTMRDGVEKALVEGVPGVTGVVVLPNEVAPTLIPLSSIGMRPTDETGSVEAGLVEAGLIESGWVRAAPVDEVAVGALLATTLEGQDASVEAIIVNAGGQMAAYVNACAHLGRRLDDAIVDAAEGTVTCLGHGFCYDSANGECLSMPGAQLESLPLRIESGQVWVRVSGSP